MGHLRAQDSQYKVGGAGSTGTGALWTPVEVDARTFDKALIIVTRGAQTGATKATVATSVYSSTTTGGTYALVASSLGTQGTSASNKVRLIEVSVSTKPFLKVYGTASTSGTSACPVAVVVELYNGSRKLPPAQDAAVTYV